MSSAEIFLEASYDAVHSRRECTCTRVTRATCRLSGGSWFASKIAGIYSWKKSVIAFDACLQNATDIAIAMVEVVCVYSFIFYLLDILVAVLC